jgi:glycosyltransferase involved in cell wall biosynthesis
MQCCARTPEGGPTIDHMAEIAIDLGWMRIGKVGGAEQAAYELVRGLAALDRENRYRLHCPRSTYHDWQFPSAFRHRVHFTDRIERERRERRGRGREPKITEPPDLFHAPSGYIPADYRGGRLIVTVHDLQHLAYPENFAPQERVYRDEQLGRLAASADHFIAISDFTARDLMQRLGIAEEKITTVWNAPDPIFAHLASTEEKDRLVRKLGVRRPFVLYPSYPWAHKNHARLLEVWKRCSGRDDGNGWQLVLTGRPFPETHPAYGALQQSIEAGRTIHLSYRSPREMRILFQAAEFLYFPSEYEGFGLPLAEAFLAGLPVAAARAGSLPEVAGDSALFFDPFSADAMEAALRRMMTEPDLREDLREKGRKRAASFSPGAMADKTLGAYRRALGADREQAGWAPPNDHGPSMNSPRFERFRHYARSCERAAREQAWGKAAIAAGAAFAQAPLRSCRRFGGGAACHVEVTLYQWFGRK